uniref:Uncharacterized protein n=1 Tax=Meloidogyne floridensis TaxID=298350 RepID=A0A915NV01_9BILA
MPRTIEHKIKLIGSTTPSSIISEYGTVERKKSPSNFDNEILHSRGNENNNRSHVSIEREQFSCRTFGERCSLGVDDSNRKDKLCPSKQISSNERRISPEIIVPAEQNKQFYQNNYLPNNIQSPPPMKRIIKKSRLVSIHDGRPLSDFVETVHYEPINYC